MIWIRNIYLIRIRDPIHYRSFGSGFLLLTAYGLGTFIQRILLKDLGREGPFIFTK
jgi:hypothetical protein